MEGESEEDGDSPADAQLLEVPVRRLLAVEDAAGVPDVLLELLRHLPLRVVCRCRGRGDVAPGEDLPDVLEERPSPPLQLPVGRGRQRAEEGALMDVSAAGPTHSILGSDKGPNSPVAAG